MAKKLDPRLIEILNQYGEDATEALWDCHGTWVAYHKAIERIAAKAGVTFDMPQIVEADTINNRAVAIVARGHMGDRSEWSFGEASPSNNKNAYPYAMAEKRAKDRVVLKLVGLHGLVYSEEESDDFKPEGSKPPLVEQVRAKAVETQYGEVDPSWQSEKRSSAASVKKGGTFEEFRADVVECYNVISLEKVRKYWGPIAKEAGWPDSILAAAHELVEQQRGVILASMSTEALADVPLKDALKHSLHMAG